MSTEAGTVHTFVGRDDLFYRLELAARMQKVVVLHGTGGTGKTELAKAFGRWWRDTGGVERPDWVFWHSFEPGVASFGLDSVIIEIGLRLFGTDFARLESAERRDVVQGMLILQPDFVTFMVGGLVAGSGWFWRGAGGGGARPTIAAGAGFLSLV